MNDEPSMYSTGEVAAMLGMNPQSIINWRSRGKGPKFLRLGDGPRPAVRYRAEDIAEFLKENK